MIETKMRQWISRILVLPLVLSCSSLMAEETIKFYVIDGDGEPLKDVVIEPAGIDEKSSTREVAVIDQVNKRFKPQQILVTQGQSVAFPNSDNIRHHVYSFSKAKVFELKLYADMPENPVQFEQHGVVVLGCNIHDTMIGYIFVSNSPDTVTTDKEGHAELVTATPVTKVNVWHKHQMSGPESLKTLTIDSIPMNGQGMHQLKITTVAPEPTNSFEDTFRGISETD